jgi:bacteriocin-like protein
MSLSDWLKKLLGGKPAESPKPEGQELSDKDLKNVSGGLGVNPGELGGTFLVKDDDADSGGRKPRS